MDASSTGFEMPFPCDTMSLERSATAISMRGLKFTTKAPAVLYLPRLP